MPLECFKFQVSSFMSIFDFLKRKKEIDKSKRPTEKKVEKALVKPEMKKSVTSDVKLTPKAEMKSKKSAKSVKDFSYNIVKEPHISEKATYLGEKNKYVFKIYDNANKPEIKKSIEGIYGVDVLSVNIIKIPAKKRRLGRTEGFKKGYRKAIVTIKEGQKIEII